MGDIEPDTQGSYKGNLSSFSFSLLPSRGETVKHQKTGEVGEV